MVGILSQSTTRSNAHETRWQFWLPRSLDLSNIPPADWRTADEARYATSVITRKMTMRRAGRDDGGFVRLNTKILGNVIRRVKVPAVLQRLEADGSIESNQRYRAGEFSRGYRLTRRMLESGPIRVRPTSPFVIEKLDWLRKRNRQVQAERRTPTHDALHSIQIAHLRIEREEANAILECMPAATKFGQTILVENILLRRMGNSVGATGRWFNAITGLSRALRPALRLNGQPLGNIDLRNAQPALLAMLAQSAICPSIGLNDRESYKQLLSCWLACSLPDVAACLLTSGSSSGLFVELASNGCLYDFLSERGGLSRDAAKDQFLVSVLAPKHEYPCDMRRLVESEFPGVAAAISLLNRGNHCCVIRLLQRLESWLVIEQVAKYLVEANVICLPLHDAIFAGERELDSVESAFRTTFNDLGFQIAMKREALKHAAALATE